MQTRPTQHISNFSQQLTLTAASTLYPQSAFPCIAAHPTRLVSLQHRVSVKLAVECTMVAVEWRKGRRGDLEVAWNISQNCCFLLSNLGILAACVLERGAATFGQQFAARTTIICQGGLLFASLQLVSPNNFGCCCFIKNINYTRCILSIMCHTPSHTQSSPFARW